MKYSLYQTREMNPFDSSNPLRKQILNSSITAELDSNMKCTFILMELLSIVKHVLPINVKCFQHLISGGIYPQKGKKEEPLAAIPLSSTGQGS